MKILLCILLILGLTLPALAADVKDLESYVTKNFTLKQGESALDAAIRLLTKLKQIQPARETQETSVVEKGHFGRTRQVYELRYLDTGELISSREEITSYYESGELKQVVQKWFDCKGKMVRHRIVKYINGQPKITEVEPKPIER